MIQSADFREQKTKPNFIDGQAVLIDLVNDQWQVSPRFSLVNVDHMLDTATQRWLPNHFKEYAPDGRYSQARSRHQAEGP
jgi:hypothetical protein